MNVLAPFSIRLDTKGFSFAIKNKSNKILWTHAFRYIFCLIFYKYSNNLRGKIELHKRVHKSIIENPRGKTTWTF